MLNKIRKNQIHLFVMYFLSRTCRWLEVQGVPNSWNEFNMTLCMVDDVGPAGDPLYGGWYMICRWSSVWWMMWDRQVTLCIVDDIWSAGDPLYGGWYMICKWSSVWWMIWDRQVLKAMPMLRCWRNCCSPHLLDFYYFIFPPPYHCMIGLWLWVFRLILSIALFLPCTTCCLYC